MAHRRARSRPARSRVERPTFLMSALLAFACCTALLTWGLAPSGCAVTPQAMKPAFIRAGDEIVVCGQYFRTGAPVVLWTDPGGYDAYRVEKRFGPLDRAPWEAILKDGRGPETPNRYGVRKAGLSEEELQRIRGGGWDLPLLQRQVDQFVLHYDVCGTSRQCFRVLHDLRGLSVHFMLDIDGTIYQTLDLKERAWHATSSNDRSIGIEIANMGAYPEGEKSPLDRWYTRDDRGIRITIPEDMGDGGIRTPNFVGRPARPDLVRGVIGGRTLVQYDLTPQQYDSLTRLTAALCAIFPRIRPDYPRGPDGELATGPLPPDELAAFTGVLGHLHVQKDKVDPGPALQWDRVLETARRNAR